MLFKNIPKPFVLLRLDYFNRAVKRVAGNAVRVDLKAAFILNKKLCGRVLVIKDSHLVIVDC